MSEMLNMVVGKLENQPAITPAFKQRILLKNYIITESDDGEERDARVPVVAWDETAEEMMQYSKGDTVHLLCVPNDSVVQVNGNMIPVLGFKILKVDHDKKIAIEVNKRIMEILDAN